MHLKPVERVLTGVNRLRTTVAQTQPGETTRPYDQQLLFSGVEPDRLQRTLRRSVIPECQNQQLNTGNDADSTPLTSPMKHRG